jgi:citrate lyase subunit beta/citryl-CoA lyase
MPLCAGPGLYVPGDRPDRFAKAATSGADVVICDLEDAVPSANKATARVAVAAWLREHRAVVRVNGVDTPWHDDDIAAAAGSPGVVAVILPKSQEPGQISEVADRLNNRIALVPLVESAAGVAKPPLSRRASKCRPWRSAASISRWTSASTTPVTTSSLVCCTRDQHS